MRFLWKTERRSAVAQRRVSCHHFHIHHFRHFSRVARKRGIYVLTRFSVPISWNRCHAARHGNPASWHIRKLSESDAQFLSSTNEPDRTAFYRRSALPATHSLSRRPVPVRQTHDSIEDGHHDDHVRLRDRPPRGSQGLRVQGEARFQVRFTSFRFPAIESATSDAQGLARDATRSVTRTKGVLGVSCATAVHSRRDPHIASRMKRAHTDRFRPENAARPRRSRVQQERVLSEMDTVRIARRCGGFETRGVVCFAR